MEVVTRDQVREHAQVHGQRPERDDEPEPARRAFVKGKATVSGGGGGGGPFADKRADAHNAEKLGAVSIRADRVVQTLTSCRWHAGA